MTKVAPVTVETKSRARSLSAQEQQAARAEKAKQVSKQKARRRHGVRLSFFVLVVLLLAAVWSLIALPGTHTTVVKAYDPAAGLSIETFGCDIDFVAGDAAWLEYRAIWAASDFQFENSADDASITEVVTASNRMGCAAEWKKACRRVCLLTVTVPASAAGAFNVKQAEGAEGEEAPWPLLTVRAGASVASIKVGDWWAYQPTISAYVDHATVGSFTWRAKDGDFTAVNSTIASANLYARGAGSIHLLGVEASGVDVPVHWRQPDHRFCASTDLRPAAASFVEGGAWDLCDISTVIDGSDLTTNWGTYSKLRGTYDANSDGRVTKEEFTGALTEMLCCGSGCPFSSWCERESYDVGFADPGLYGRSVNDFAALLYATNKTSWMPKCMSALTLAHASAAPSPPPSLPTITMFSTGGALTLTLRQGGGPTERPSVGGDDAPGWWSPVNQTWSPPGRPTGLKIARTDAARLKTTYGETYGCDDCEGDLFLAIDVVGGAGYPHARFLYVTNVAFLSIDPSHLTFLTFGMLAPPVARERVRFSDNSCEGEAQTLDPAATNRSLASMHEQLHRALQADQQRSYLPLRGALVLVGDGFADQWGNMELLEVDDDGGFRTWENPYVRDTLRASITLSAVVGGLLGVIFVASMYTVLAKIQHQAYNKKLADRKVGLQKRGIT